MKYILFSLSLSKSLSLSIKVHYFSYFAMENISYVQESHVYDTSFCHLGYLNNIFLRAFKIRWLLADYIYGVLDLC